MIAKSSANPDDTTDVTTCNNSADATNMNTGGGYTDDVITGDVNTADAVKTTTSTGTIDTVMADTTKSNKSDKITDTYIEKNHLGISNFN